MIHCYEYLLVQVLFFSKCVNGVIVVFDGVLVVLLGTVEVVLNILCLRFIWAFVKLVLCALCCLPLLIGTVFHLYCHH